ncbi:MAG: hypothetical protein Q9163_006489, partial [Psora crenata]
CAAIIIRTVIVDGDDEIPLPAAADVVDGRDGDAAALLALQFLVEVEDGALFVRAVHVAHAAAAREEGWLAVGVFGG